ncbi:MAG: hypothetical protein WC162_05180 [Sphaerochaetaceae bacterium]|nr:hypothetical protein [Sphaerochaetaceae bacterium]
MKNTLKGFIIVLVCLSILSSCTVTQNISLENDNQGTTTMLLYADDFFNGVLQDLSPYLGTDKKDESVLENAVENMAQKIKQAPATSDSFFFKADENNYLGNIKFLDINSLLDYLTDMKDQNLFIISNNEEKGKSHLEININMNNWDKLCKILPFLSEENFEVYGPVYNNGLSEEDYLDMIGFILGEDGPDKIKDSDINLIFQAPSKIQNSDGEMLEDNITAFNIPLIKLLLLNDPIKLECTW